MDGWGHGVRQMYVYQQPASSARRPRPSRRLATFYSSMSAQYGWRITVCDSVWISVACNTLCRFVIEYIAVAAVVVIFRVASWRAPCQNFQTLREGGEKEKKKKATTVRLTASSFPSQLVAHSTSFFFPFGLPARLFHLARPFLLNPTSTSSYLSHFGSRRSSSRHAPGHPVAFNERIKRPDSDQRIITNGATSNGTPRLLSIPPSATIREGPTNDAIAAKIGPFVACCPTDSPSPPPSRRRRRRSTPKHTHLPNTLIPLPSKLGAFRTSVVQHHSSMRYTI